MKIKDAKTFYSVNGYMQMHVVFQPLFFSIHCMDERKVGYLCQKSLEESQDKILPSIKIKNDEGLNPLEYALLKIEKLL